MTSSLSPQRLQRERERDAWGQLGDAQACAETVAWLLSPQARGISGQVFNADARLW
jgi:NAD(P)-dependent dehydrogenase (short-subunit alcohol dehydrogenase family)